ncbi:MAG: CRISPR-associated protein Csx15 [Anaerolineae bacterium]
MILLNFSHPLSAEQTAAIEALLQAPVQRVLEVRNQMVAQQPLAPQVTAMADAAGLTPMEWQNEAILVNPPSLNYSAVTLLAELHGRMGYFPACVRLRPVAGAVPPRFEVAEILNIQAIRDTARQRGR